LDAIADKAAALLHKLRWDEMGAEISAPVEASKLAWLGALRPLPEKA
jgi:hypothetical protein